MTKTSFLFAGTLLWPRDLWRKGRQETRLVVSWAKNVLCPVSFWTLWRHSYTILSPCHFQWQQSIFELNVNRNRISEIRSPKNILFPTISITKFLSCTLYALWGVSPKFSSDWNVYFESWTEYIQFDCHRCVTKTRENTSHFTLDACIVIVWLSQFGKKKTPNVVWYWFGAYVIWQGIKMSKYSLTHEKISKSSNSIKYFTEREILAFHPRISNIKCLKWIFHPKMLWQYHIRIDKPKNSNGTAIELLFSYFFLFIHIIRIYPIHVAYVSSIFQGSLPCLVQCMPSYSCSYRHLDSTRFEMCAFVSFYIFINDSIIGIWHSFGVLWMICQPTSYTPSNWIFLFRSEGVNHMNAVGILW